MNKNYTVYHLHSDYSNGVTNIDSVTGYKDYVEQAYALGMKALGFSEHGNVFGHHKKRIAVEEKGMKYIHASEFYVTKTLEENVRDNYHVILIAKDDTGFRELNRLSSKSFNRSNVSIVDGDAHYYYHPRITFDELLNTSEHVIITTACLGGILNSDDEELKHRYINFLKAHRERCFLEIQHHAIGEQVTYNQYLYGLSTMHGIPLIAGTDTHALNEEHMIGRTVLQNAKRVKFSSEEQWDLTFKSYDELVAAYRQQNALPSDVYIHAIENTNRLADMVGEYTMNRDIKYPKIYDNPNETFRKIVYESCSNHPYLRKRHSDREIVERVQNELEVYEKTKSVDFMLLQYRLRKWERENGIYCGYGRGSVSGSEVAYGLHITDMDAMRFGLNFFRFMNPSRVTNADIDTDYSSVDRDRVKHYILHDKMNVSSINSAEIITFNTIALKGSIRDVCRSLYANTNVNYLKLADKIANNIEFDEEKKRRAYPEIFRYVDIIRGTIVSIGCHASGVLISDANIAEDIGLCSIKSSNYPISQLDMKELDDLMYVKLDILGLDNIGIINETCKSVGIERLTPDNTPLDDVDVWKSIRDDSTTIFQWESVSAQNFLRSFMSDKTIEIAKRHNPSFSYIKWFSFGNGLIRPGCASFRDDVAKGEFFVTGFKELDDFLAPTFGRITMQEDIMRFLVRFCGYSDAESDTVRRGIAKKYGTDTFIEEIQRRFISYSSEMYGMSTEKLAEIFPPIRQGILDATDYAFSWNHSDSYSCIGYICGYLRYYYPIEYLTACLNVAAAKSDTDKVSQITAYCKQNGIAIRSIEFRKSRGDYFAQDQMIYKGLFAVKGLRKASIDQLVQLYSESFDTFFDFLYRAVECKIGLSDIELLLKVDFFREFGELATLIRDFSLFKQFHDIKQIRKEKALTLKIPFEILRRYGKETNALFVITDIFGLLKALQDILPIDPVSMKQRITYQCEILGGVEMADKKYENICYCTKIDTKYSPRITLYALANGNLISIRINKKLFSTKPVNVGDIIKVNNGVQKKKVVYTDNGYITSDETEWWITQYDILENID